MDPLHKLIDQRDDLTRQVKDLESRLRSALNTIEYYEARNMLSPEEYEKQYYAFLQRSFLRGAQSSYSQAQNMATPQMGAQWFRMLGGL